MATIKVCVRVRPFLQELVDGERSEGHELCVKMPTKTRVDIYSNDAGPRSFEFDRCYWSINQKHPLYATQETLAEELGATMLDHAMNGFNNCIFAYGQTGSGKSFSVLGGSGKDRGLLPRMVDGLFEHFARADKNIRFKTFVAFLEIYNEQIRDLLATRDPQGQEKEAKLEVKQHPVLGTIIPGLTEAAVGNVAQVFDLIEYGTAMRHVSATAMNATSSRSHCIFTFKTSIRDKETGQAKMSQTHLVDLAGSERAGRTKATGDRLKEGAMINQSLSTLARVISALAKKKDTNAPFRDSKLTYILKESLCGNSKTVMMAAISPSSADYEETLSTLKFAQSVKQVQTHAVCNDVNERDLEAKLKKYVDSYRKKLEWYEAEKSNDKRRISILQRRLAEQEQLVKQHGTEDADDLLMAERNKDKKRKGTLAMIGDEEELKKLVQLEKTRRRKWKKKYKHRRHKDTGNDSASEESSGDLGSGSSSSSSSSSSVSAPKGLVVPYPDEEEFCLLKSEVAEVMLAMQARGPPSVQLQAMVALDTDCPAGGHLLVRASPRAGTQPLNDATAGSSGVEWLSGEQLHARLMWLRDAAANGATTMDGSNGHNSSWAAAAAALMPHPPPARRPSVSVAEVERLRAELAAMQVELSEARQRLTAEEVATAEARSALEVETRVAHSVCLARNAAGGENSELCGRNAKSLAAAVAASFADAISALDAAQVALEGGTGRPRTSGAGTAGQRRRLRTTLEKGRL